MASVPPGVGRIPRELSEGITQGVAVRVANKVGDGDCGVSVGLEVGGLVSINVDDDVAVG